MKRKIPVLLTAALMMFATACSNAESTQSSTGADAVSKEQKAEEMGEDRQEKGEKKSKDPESEAAVKDEESRENEVEVLNLFYTEPLMSKLVWTESSAKTKAEGESWTDVLQFSPSEVGTIVAYEAGGKYEVLKARVAPEEDWENDDIARIIVYGDGDVVLYESPEITKETKAFDMEADIRGLQAVSIKAVSIEGGSGHILLKDAVFE